MCFLFSCTPFELAKHCWNLSHNCQLPMHLCAQVCVECVSVCVPKGCAFGACSVLLCWPTMLPWQWGGVAIWKAKTQKPKLTHTHSTHSNAFCWPFACCGLSVKLTKFWRLNWVKYCAFYWFRFWPGLVILHIYSSYNIHTHGQVDS